MKTNQEQVTNTELSSKQDENTEIENKQDADETTEFVKLTQSELDKKLTNAAFKARQNLEAELAKKHQEELEKQLVEKGEYKKLYESTKDEFSKLQKQIERNQFEKTVLDKATKNNLTSYLDILTVLPDDDSVDLMIEKLKNVDSKIKSEILENKSPNKNKSSNVLGEMSMEEWKEKRKTLGINLR